MGGEGQLRSTIGQQEVRCRSPVGHVGLVLSVVETDVVVDRRVLGYQGIASLL